MSGTEKGLGRKLRALVVEPDRHAADQAITLLQDLGYAAHAARDGREGLASLTRPPMLVLLDSAPPTAKAIELLRAMKRMRELQDVPVIGTYERPRPPDDQMALLKENGVRAFVERPFTAEDIEDALDGGHRSVFSSNSLAGFGEDDNSLPPFVSQIRRPVDGPVAGPDPTPQADWNVRPPGATTDPAIPSLAAAQTLPTVPDSVGGVLEWDGSQVPCIIESASAQQLIVRTPQPPPVGTQTRAFIAFRAVVDDSPQQLPIRILGAVSACEALRSGTRVTLDIRVAKPQENLERLGRYLRAQV